MPLSGSSVQVIVPTYNRADYLRTAIESVLTQSHRDLRLLVADNASIDHTRDVVESFSDPRLTYVRRPQNLGWTGNYNAALATVDSEFVCVLGDDDVPYPKFLETTMAALREHPGAGMVHGLFDLIGPSGDVLRPAMRWGVWHESDTVETGAEFIRESMIFGCRACQSTVLCRTAALPETPFEPSEGAPADLALWLRIALSWDVAFVAHPLAAYRIHDASLTSQVGIPGEEGYRMSFDLVESVRSTKLRFLDENADRLPDVSRLRTLVRRGTCWDLTNAIRTATSPQRRLLPTLRMMGKAIGIDRRITIDRGAWKLVAASVLGPRAIERLRRRRATSTEAA